MHKTVYMAEKQRKTITLAVHDNKQPNYVFTVLPLLKMMPTT